MTSLATRRHEALLPPAATPVTGLPEASEVDLGARVREILYRRPAVGLALAIVKAGQPTSFHVHGLADIASNTPITEDTVFRIGSVTKLFTAIAAMQLAERGLVNLDAPANEYLRAYQLVPRDATWRPAALRDLLTHTAGVPEVRGLRDLLNADFTPSGGRSAMPRVRAGEPLPTLAQYYRDGLRVEVEPGTAFAYSNHGFATLGQVVEDVSGMPLERYFREHMFEPLGMRGTDLVRSEGIASRLATGYLFGRRGPEAVPDLDELGAGGGGIYSSLRDMARFAAALLNSGAGEPGRILGPGTLATMFEPQFQPDPRIPGLGLAFFRAEVGGHRVVAHDGIMPGFNSALLLAPDDGVGVVAFTNGSSGAFAWLQIELHSLIRQLLGLPDDAPRTDIPHHPEIWTELCGRYVLQPRISDLRGRLMMGGGAEVFMRGGRLMVRVLTPVPALYRGFPLAPGDEHDPDVFRLDLSEAGMATVRVVFARSAAGQVTAVHTDLGGQPWSLVRPNTATRQWLKPALGTLAVAGVVAAGRRRGRRRRELQA
jgi:CubicO group peptidase (beta-lactamase class C family)